MGTGGRVFAELAEGVAWPRAGAAQVTAFRCPMRAVEDEIFFLDLRLTTEAGAATNRYPFTRAENLAPFMASLPPTALVAAVETGDDAWRVTLRNAGAFVAFGVWLEDARERGATGWPGFDDKYFFLLPGEMRAVRVAWQGVPAAERKLVVGGWNTGGVCVSAP